MTVDVLDPEEANRLPIGSVVLLLDPYASNEMFVRTYVAWYSEKSRYNILPHTIPSVGAKDRVPAAYQLIYLSAESNAPLVRGNRTDDWQALAKLPLGSVIVDVDDDCELAAEIKMGPNNWAYAGSQDDSPGSMSDRDHEFVTYEVLYIPGAALADGDSDRPA